MSGPTRRAQGERDEIRQPVKKVSLALFGVAGFELIVVLVLHRSMQREQAVSETSHGPDHDGTRAGRQDKGRWTRGTRDRWVSIHCAYARLREPALAAAVMLSLSERLAAAFGD